MSLEPDIVTAWLDSKGANNVRYYSYSDQIRSSCPFHQGSNTTALTVDLNTGFVKCYSCGYTTNINHLQTDEGQFINKYSNKADPPDNSELGEEILKSFNLSYTHPKIIARCRSPELLQFCGTGFATEGSYANRAIFQYRDLNNKLHGFKSRGVRKDDMIIDDYYDFRSTFFLENLYSGHLPPVIVEGEWDAINLLSLGFIDVIAIGGSSINQQKVNKLAKMTSTILLALDNDWPGLDASIKIRNKLNGLFTIYKIPYIGEDPGSISDAEVFRRALCRKYKL